MKQPTLPVRRLTVTCGRDTLGYIKEVGERQFLALSSTGAQLGIYPTSGDAAQAVNNARQIGGGS